MYNMTLKILWLPQPLTLAFGMQLLALGFLFSVFFSVCVCVKCRTGSIILVIIFVVSDSDSMAMRVRHWPGRDMAKNKFKSHSSVLALS